MKHQAYFTRAMQAKDRRFARIFAKLGYETADMVAEEPGKDDLAELRATYEKVIGKRPFMGWDAETLAAKIAEAKGR